MDKGDMVGESVSEKFRVRDLLFTLVNLKKHWKKTRLRLDKIDLEILLKVYTPAQKIKIK